MTTSYAYDGDGKRASTTAGATTTRYTHDVNTSLPVLLDDGSRKYVWGAGGLTYTVDTSGAISVHHTDGLGSVRALTDASGAVVQTYQTDEFGIPLAGGTQGSQTQPFSYTGEQRDAETGFSYLRARMYDPSVGRFLQRDPFAGQRTRPKSLNRYTYALDDPTTLADSSGLITGGVCVNFAIGAFVYVTGSFCSTIASNGDIGAAISAGGGGTTRFIGGLSVGPQLSTGNRLSDLRGPFVTGGFSWRVLAGGGADVFTGRNSSGDLVTGGSAQVGRRKLHAALRPRVRSSWRSDGYVDLRR